MTRSSTSQKAPVAIKVAAFPTYVVAALTLSLFGTWCSLARATEIHSQISAHAQIELKSILLDSGITRLYKNVAATVLAESRAARAACDDSPALADKIQRFISQSLQVDEMIEASVEKLSRQIDTSTLDEIVLWMNSSAGRAIMDAEAQSSDWSEEQFAQRELALDSDPNWNDVRRALIVRVLKSAATVPFVTAMHSETSALVLQAADCIASDVSRAQLDLRIQKARVDEAFYSVFLRKNMVLSAGVIFSNVSNRDLEAYAIHSSTAAGRVWSDALLNVIRQVLSERHEPVQHFLAFNSHK